VNRSDLENLIRASADQCVKCGFCLPHCPTYRLRLDEAESPRGRIALAQGLVDGQIAPSPRLDAHLGSCLECRACELVCPSLVGVGQTMDGVRALRRETSGWWARLWTRTWLDALSSPAGARAAAGLSSAYRASGLAHLMEDVGFGRLPRFSAYHRVALQLRTPRRLAAEPNELPTAQREIDLFIGCVARAAQPNALTAAHHLLARLGFRVRIPPTQACCGALHRHNGFPERADQMLDQNASAFQGRPLTGIAAACVAELRTHPALGYVQEICRLLANHDWPDTTRLRPLKEIVAVHVPCSQRNMLRDPSAASDLLRRIPAIRLVSLPENAFCCGAAGSYLLHEPETAQALLAPKLRELLALDARILVTTNTGCALHVAAGAREAGLRLEVLHPVELVLRQLDTDEPNA
jgi:glycolate oxidase iron-sulfur subunit